MAKGQKRSTREPRKPKQPKAKPSLAPHSFLGAIERPAGATPGRPKSPRP